MKLIIACLLVAALTFIPSCGPEVEDQTAASTGAGGSSSSSSSSSGEGGMGGAGGKPVEFRAVPESLSSLAKLYGIADQF